MHGASEAWSAPVSRSPPWYVFHLEPSAHLCSDGNVRFGINSHSYIHMHSHMVLDVHAGVANLLVHVTDLLLACVLHPKLFATASSLGGSVVKRSMYLKARRNQEGDRKPCRESSSHD